MKYITLFMLLLLSVGCIDNSDAVNMFNTVTEEGCQLAKPVYNGVRIGTFIVCTEKEFKAILKSKK